MGVQTEQGSGAEDQKNEEKWKNKNGGSIAILELRIY